MPGDTPASLGAFLSFSFGQNILSGSLCHDDCTSLPRPRVETQRELQPRGRGLGTRHQAPGHLGTWTLGTWAPGHLAPGTWAPGTCIPALLPESLVPAAAASVHPPPCLPSPLRNLLLNSRNLLLFSFGKSEAYLYVHTHTQVHTRVRTCTHTGNARPPQFMGVKG